MKRFIALLLTLSLLLSLCACSVNEEELQEAAKDAAEEVVDAAVDWGKNAIKTWWNNATDSLFDSVLGENFTIHFDANGGEGAPEDQSYRDFFLLNTVDKATPTRPGYHFMGWTRNPEDTTPRFFSGKKPDQPLTQDTTLYALWGTIEEGNGCLTDNFPTLDAEYPLALWLDHKYTVECDDNNLVTIRCSCGAEITDRTISKDLFSCYKYSKNTTYENLNKKQKPVVDREYALYITQEYAPAILYFIGMVSRDAAAEYPVMDGFSDFLSTMNSAAEQAANYSLGTNVPQGEAQRFFGAVSGVAKHAGNAIGVLKGAFYFAEMCKQKGHPEASTVNFIATMRVVANFTPAGDYYDALLSTLSEGITLYFDCQEKLNSLYNSLLPAFDGKTAIRNFLNIDHVIQAFNISNGSATYDNFLYEAPSAYEVIDFLAVPTGTNADGEVITVFDGLTPEEKQVFSFYIALRLKMEFESLAGIPLETYISYVSE